MKVSLEKNKLFIIIGIVLILATNFATYKITSKRVDENAKRLIEQFDTLSKIDFDYINSLNALYQTTMEWGNINSRLNVKYASDSATANDIAKAEEDRAAVIKDMEELTKLVLRFKAARETLLTQGGK